MVVCCAGASSFDAATATPATTAPITTSGVTSPIPAPPAVPAATPAAAPPAGGLTAAMLRLLIPEAALGGSDDAEMLAGAAALEVMAEVLPALNGTVPAPLLDITVPALTVT